MNAHSHKVTCVPDIHMYKNILHFHQFSANTFTVLTFSAAQCIQVCTTEQSMIYTLDTVYQ